MRSFFAMIWNDRDNEASNAAALLKTAIHETLGAKLDHINAVGFSLYNLDNRQDQIVSLRDEKEQCTGAIYGTIFDRDSLSPATRAIRSLDQNSVKKLGGSEGSSLLRDYWGSYVAFIATPKGFVVITDPTSAIPCFVCVQGTVTLVFSHLERCPFIDRRGFTINDAFVIRLLTYDKIQNGETGLIEVRELIGGERFYISSPSSPPELLWDPRQIARLVHEPVPQDAADELRHTIHSVVGAWAHCYESISLNLSGGLDSAILLAALARTHGVGNLNAVHFRLDSSDPPEDRYAQLMADHVGCEFVEILESPGHAIASVDEHPATVRPYRQFITQDIATRMGDKSDFLKQVLFTGQGGDHLFLHTKSELIFADHLLRHGITRTSGAHLLEAARLSERSVWAVLQRSLPYWMGKTHQSRMIASIESRRVAINRPAFGILSIEDSLPIWARTSAGLPPAKYDQVGNMAHMIQAREPMDRFGNRDVVHPLISQPLIEFCLRLPTYLLCARGESRGLARRAFASDLPESIRKRSSKGEASRFFVAYLKANSGIIIDALRDGELVSRGLITRSEVEKLTRQSEHQIQTYGRSMLVYYAIEAWLQSWKKNYSMPNQ